MRCGNGRHAILLAMSQRAASRPPRTKLHGVIASFFRPYTRPLCGILVMAVATAVLGAAEPLLLKMVFDAFGGGATGAQRGLVFVVALVVALLMREAISGLLDFSSWKV